MITKKNIEKFIKVRNDATYHTNLQFQIDADACGFSTAELPAAQKVDGAWRWDLPFGTLVEELGMLRLEEPHTDDERIDLIADNRRKAAQQ